MKQQLFTAFILVAISSAHAELKSLDDSELQKATGEGLGFAIEDFMLDTDGSSLKVTGIKDTNGGEIDINWTKFYIMGEGSQNGTIKTVAQVGSYLNPWYLRTARGSRGLSVTDADYNAGYTGIGNDVALIDFATDSYTNVLQNSKTFSQFSLYQGCIYGQPGCTDLGYVGGDSLAERTAQAELNTLTSEQSALQARYSSGITLTQIEQARDNTYAYQQSGGIWELEQNVDSQRDVVNAQKVDTRTAYDAMTSAEQTETPFLVEVDCGFLGLSCSTAERNYNDELATFSDDRAQLEIVLDDLKVAENDAGRTGIGQSYITVVQDVDRYKALCGYTDALATCSDGLISKYQKKVNDTESVAFYLSNGSARRNGLDVGFTFEFTLNRDDGSTRDDYLGINIKGLFVDGSSLKLWSRPDKNDPTKDELNAELRLNMFAKEIDILACNETDCPTQTVRDANTLNLDNVYLSLNLGYGDVQPLKFSATSDGNFEYTLENPDPNSSFANPTGMSAKEFYEDYYKNAPKSNLYIGDVRIGDTNSIGAARIVGMRAQYLKVTSQDL